ncbi:MAG: sulfatase [Planctomycetales bacterium]|nr:sulfatase [Planctomycetales bacterium]
MKIPRLAILFVAATVLIVPTGTTIKAAERPNILVAISDDQSYPHASAYGDATVRTPAFDRVAASGVLFTHAFAPSPGCSPCRASLLTGRYPWQIEQAGTHASSFPQKYLAFPDLLERQGYFVGYTGKGWGPGDWRVSGRSRNPAGPEFAERHVDTPRPGGVSDCDYAANFADFLRARPDGQPFCFWFGAKEPHRVFEQGSGLKAGKSLDTVAVPEFLPDTPEVRSDMLDYYLEIEWFDAHLARMLERLDEAGELDNTLVIVTSDNGMSFPRAKANCYEYGFHEPLAVCWPAGAQGGRTVDDLVSFVDLTATILDVAGVRHPHADDPALAPVGNSLRTLLASNAEGTVEPERDGVYSARERHSSSRYRNWTYPQRALRTREYLYIRNFHPERWPAGDPQKYEDDGRLGPLHGGYHDIDACPTLTFLVEHRDDPGIAPYFHLAVDHRPAEELYLVGDDPACLVNLADDPAHAEQLATHRKKLEEYLSTTGDPRMGHDGDIYDRYRRYSKIRRFPPPAE